MNFSCPICSDNLSRAPGDPTNKEGSKISCAPCGHIFHVFCITKWLDGTLATSSQCPCCRKSIPRKKCLPLFPTLHDESIAEDPEESNCNHGPILEELRTKITATERKVAEKDLLNQTLTVDCETYKTKLRQEMKRSDELMIKYKEAESYRTYSKELQNKVTTLEVQLDSLQKINSLIDSVKKGKEAEEFDYPPTKESVATLKTMNAMLDKELRVCMSKHKEVQNRLRSETQRREEIRRELDKLKSTKEGLEDVIATLKLEIEELRGGKADDTASLVNTPEITPKRKRCAEESVIILSPDVDQDVMIMKPLLHRRREMKTKSSSQSSVDSGVYSESSKISSSQLSKKVDQLTVEDSDMNLDWFVNSGPAKDPQKPKKKRLFNYVTVPGSSSATMPTSSASKESASDPLTPQGFTENLKSSLPGLSRTPSGTFLKSKPIPKNLLPKPAKVLKKS